MTAPAELHVLFAPEPDRDRVRMRNDCRQAFPESFPGACRWLQLLLILALAAGCAPALRHFPPLPLVDNPARYLQALADSRRNVPRLSGMLKLTVSGRLINRSTKNIFFAEQPHFLRIEILGIFNQPAAYIFADNQTLQVYLIDANTLYSGAASAENIAAITGMYLSPSDIVQVLQGFPPICGIDDATSITCIQKRSEYFFTVTAPASVEWLTIVPDLQKVVHYSRTCRGVARFEIDFFDFNLYCNLALPERISFYSHHTGLRTMATLSSISTEPFPHDVFSFIPPGSARHAPLEALLTQPSSLMAP